MRDRSRRLTFFSLSKLPTSAYNLIRHLASGAFGHYHTIFLPAAWSVVPNKISFNPPECRHLPLSLSLSLEDYFAVQYSPVRLLQHRRIPGPSSSYCRPPGVVNQAIALIFRHQSIREQGAITIARSTEGLPFASKTRINASPVPGSWIAFRYQTPDWPAWLRRSFTAFSLLA